jgi:hypothetical protein
MSRSYLSQRTPQTYSQQVFAGILADQDRENTRLTTFAGTATWNPASVADGDAVSTTVSVPGARVGVLASVRVFVPYSLQGLLAGGYVSADNTVTIVLLNNTGGAVDLGSGVWGVVVESFIQT